MVIITYLPWHDTFLKLLIVLAELRRTDQNGFRTFLSETYSRGVPDSGGSLTVFYNGGQSVRLNESQVFSSTYNINIIFFLEFYIRTSAAISTAQYTEKRKLQLSNLIN